MRTNQPVTINFREYGAIVIPQGTPLTHQTASGIDKKYHFVNAFGWIDENYPKVANILKMDAQNYGIDIPKEFVDYETTEQASSVDFWVRQFEPRGEEWQRTTLARLEKGVSAFETAQDNANKIEALKSLLNQ